MLKSYRAHVIDRAEQGALPLPLSATQTLALTALLKSPPEGEGEELVALISSRVPAGVDEAAKVKAEFLFSLAAGEEKSPLISKRYATQLLGTMQGGYNVKPLIDLLSDNEVGKVAAECLKKTLLIFDRFNDVKALADQGNLNAQDVFQSWADGEWFSSRPQVPEIFTGFNDRLCSFAILIETG